MSVFFNVSIMSTDATIEPSAVRDLYTALFKDAATISDA